MIVIGCYELVLRIYRSQRWITCPAKTPSKLSQDASLACPRTPEITAFSSASPLWSKRKVELDPLNCFHLTFPEGQTFQVTYPDKSQGWAGVGHKTEQLSGHFLSPDAPALPALLSQWLLLLSDSCPRSLLLRDVCSHSTALPAPSHLASSLSLEAPPKDTCPARSLALCSPFQRVLALISLFLPSAAQAPVQFLP